MKNTQPLLYTGMFAVIIAIVTHIVGWVNAGWLFAAGAIMILLYRTFEMKKASNVTEQRLYKIHFVSGIFLLVAAYFMLIGKEYWKIIILIFALLDLYVSFRLKKKEEK